MTIGEKQLISELKRQLRKERAEIRRLHKLMKKYIVKVGDKYLTKYGSLTVHQEWAERHKEYGDAETCACEYEDNFDVDAEVVMVSD